MAGVQGYASVAEIPDPLDLAVISVPGEYVLGAVEDALGSGVRALVVPWSASPRSAARAWPARSSCSHSSARTAPG